MTAPSRSLNRLAARTVALHAGGNLSDRRELLDMLGLLDNTGRVIAPDDVRSIGITTIDRSPAPAGPPAAKATARPGRRAKPIEHGTPQGYFAHRNRQQPILDDDSCGCRAAGNAYTRARKAAKRPPPPADPREVETQRLLDAGVSPHIAQYLGSNVQLTGQEVRCDTGAASPRPVLLGILGGSPEPWYEHDRGRAGGPAREVS